MDWISWWPDVFRNVLFKTGFCCIKYQQIEGQLSVGNSKDIVQHLVIILLH